MRASFVRCKMHVAFVVLISLYHVRYYDEYFLLVAPKNEHVNSTLTKG